MKNNLKHLKNILQIYSSTKLKNKIEFIVNK